MKEFRIRGFETAKEDKQQKEIRRIFRSVFSSEDGKTALNVLLSDLRFFRPCETQDETALCEYAKLFLRKRLGIESTTELMAALVSAANITTQEQ